MARVLRSALPDGYFHVFARGVDGIPPFPEADDRWVFMRLIGMCETRFEVEIVAIAVLTTHYHFVIRSSRVALSQAMQWLNGTYGRGFNKRHARFGSVFAERFSSLTIDSEESLGNRCTYVYENPVRAGLCERPEDWPWAYNRYGSGSAVSGARPNFSV